MSATQTKWICIQAIAFPRRVPFRGLQPLNSRRIEIAWQDSATGAEDWGAGEEEPGRGGTGGGETGGRQVRILILYRKPSIRENAHLVLSFADKSAKFANR